MKDQLLFRSLEGTNTGHNLEVPAACPICHHATSPEPIFGSESRTAEGKRLHHCFRCDRPSCQSLFLAEYEFSEAVGAYRLNRVLPSRAVAYLPPDLVKELSPSYEAMYNEALHAEQLGLLQVAGPGYQRAFEFLLKDFLSLRNPAKTDSVRMSSVSKLLADASLHQTVVKVCRRVSSLSAELLPFEHRWSQQELSALRQAITAMESWINSELLIASVSEGKQDSAYAFWTLEGVEHNVRSRVPAVEVAPESDEVPVNAGDMEVVAALRTISERLEKLERRTSQAVPRTVTELVSERVMAANKEIDLIQATPQPAPQPEVGKSSEVVDVSETMTKIGELNAKVNRIAPRERRVGRDQPEDQCPTCAMMRKIQSQPVILHIESEGGAQRSEPVAYNVSESSEPFGRVEKLIAEAMTKLETGLVHQTATETIQAESA